MPSGPGVSCFLSYLLQLIFLLGKEEYQVLIWWVVAAAAQLWIDPQDWPGSAVPGGAPPSEKGLGWSHPFFDL